MKNSPAYILGAFPIGDSECDCEVPACSRKAVYFVPLIYRGHIALGRACSACAEAINKRPVLRPNQAASVLP